MAENYFRHDFLRSADGALVYFQVHGDGRPALVLCDGLGCDGFAWKYLLPQLAQRHRVVRWHYRGHGQSTVPIDKEHLGMSYNCQDLSRVLDAAGAESAVIFGHSMGVQVALEFTRLFPARVVGLVLLCGSYGNPLDTIHDLPILKSILPGFQRIVRRFPTTVASLCRLLLRTELALQLTLSLELNRSLLRKGDIVPYFQHLSEMDPAVFLQTLESLAEHTAWSYLHQVRTPTLIIGGERDRFTPMWLSRRMADNMPNAELKVVPHGSHTAPLEDPELVWRWVESFLRKFSAEPVKESPSQASPAVASLEVGDL